MWIVGENSSNDKKFLLNKIIDYINSNGALIIVMKYGIFGVLWILLSDSILEVIAGDFETYRQLQTYKGWLFILITIIIVYFLINSSEMKIKIATEKTFKAINELKYMAYYDMLTGLPNRTMFGNKIRGLAADSKCKLAIAFFDIDNFKYINDTVGHSIGDEFLKFIGNVLLQEVNAPDIAARLGGDEFAILFKDYDSKEMLIKKLEILKNKIGNTWSSGGREFFISMSIGVAIYPNDGYDLDDLLKNSDIAMYTAKKEGKNKIFFYEEVVHEETLSHMQMANKLQKGLDNSEFELYYQPQIELCSGKIIGFEALVRWNHDGEGFISPSEFIPAAEITGQIYELERRIIGNALLQKKEWEEQGLMNFELSINLSSKSIISNIHFKQIEDMLSEYELDYSNIVIEITETAIISNIEIAVEKLNILRSKGLKIALDDFGTGFSSITYLKKLPIDIIKLDESYINSKHSEEKDMSIVKFIVLLAHDLGYKVIAEGIETIEQLEYLKSINCEIGQGYYIGQPMSIEDINKILHENDYITNI